MNCLKLECVYHVHGQAIYNERLQQKWKALDNNIVHTGQLCSVYDQADESD